MRMDHSIGLGEEDVRRCCKRSRKPVLDKRTGKDRGKAEDVDDRSRRVRHD